MKRAANFGAALLFAAAVSAAHADSLPGDTLQELHAAEHQLQEAALLRNVASDDAEAQHLLTARDLLAEAEPSLHGGLRQRAQLLEYDIARDAGSAAVDVTSPVPDALGPVSVLPTLDRTDLGSLARRGKALLRSADVCRTASAASACG
ncbi:MAG: hypothetical protein ACM3PU_18415 [Gemmatimonadota bacterium]